MGSREESGKAKFRLRGPSRWGRLGCGTALCGVWGRGPAVGLDRCREERAVPPSPHWLQS